MSALIVALTGDLDGLLKDEKIILPYLSLLRKLNIKATIFATTEFVETYPEIIKKILHEGHELAGHGDVHERFDVSFKEQKKRLENMKEKIKDTCGVEVKGFRAPWLSYNAKTYKALEVLGMEYSSNVLNKLFFHRIPFLGSVYSLSSFSKWIKTWFIISQIFLKSKNFKPYRVGKIVEIPITSPDDHKLIDAPEGPKFKPEESAKIGEIWKSVFELLPRDSVYVLQAHPHRVASGYLPALENFLIHAIKHDTRFYTLYNLNKEFRESNHTRT